MYLEFSLQVDKSKFMVASCDIWEEPMLCLLAMDV